MDPQRVARQRQPPPDWVATPLLRVLGDMNAPTQVALSYWWEPDGERGLLCVQELGSSSIAGHRLEEHRADAEALAVELADWLGEQLFPETRAAWGEARPACPGHPHPAQPRVLNGVATWTCPTDGRALRPIGSLSSA